MSELAHRRAETDARIAQLRKKLTRAEDFLKHKACVFATGSFGRREAGRHSDLDLFIAGKNERKRGTDATGPSLLKGLNEICVKADLIKVTRELGIPEFSGEGRYLTHFSANEFTETLGTPHDDVTNTFTARVLLVLESRPLLEPAVYREVIEQVIYAYWRDYRDHKADFMPAFLANDILRLWRTFCVNYEARTERVPKLEKARGKLKNYKLKHSRLLTCYSGLLYLLAVYRRKRTVHPSDCSTMIDLTPTERLEWIQSRPELAHASRKIQLLLSQYERFLEVTSASEEKLINQFMQKQSSQKYLGDARKFGDLVFDVLDEIGSGNPFYRLLVV